ncbi:hypothetical protein B0H10DRAFT_2230467 [Mycena sp. CBHHK59/15]|nr:hypothetical protein B0H10DRAFT_2230467 [Mycena sp. CBHHK59/15]
MVALTIVPTKAALIPPLAALVASNDAPLPTHISAVQEILYDRNAALAEFANEISKLELKLGTLRSKYAEEVSEIAQYTPVLSPVRRLPLEIIAEIFLYFTPTLSTNLIAVDQAKLPWKLGHIFRHWRMIALSLHQLWSLLDLWPYGYSPECHIPLLLTDSNWEYADEEEFTTLPDRFCDEKEIRESHYTESTLEFMEECIKRTGQHALTSRLSSHAQHFSLFPLFDALMKHSHMWHHIVLVAPPQSLLHRLSETPGKFKELRKISLAGSGLGPQEYYRPRICTLEFQAIPNLTDLTLQSISLPRTSHLCIPWSQLTKYRELDCVWTHGNRWSSYRQLINLNVLCLRFENTGYSPVEETPVVLPSLLFASFCAYGTQEICCFDMPALKTLQIAHLSFEPFSFKTATLDKLFNLHRFTTG